MCVFGYGKIIENFQLVALLEKSTRVQIEFDSYWYNLVLRFEVFFKIFNLIFIFLFSLN
jgi:hypothetical protein